MTFFFCRGSIQYLFFVNTFGNSTNFIPRGCSQRSYVGVSVSEEVGTKTLVRTPCSLRPFQDQIPEEEELAW